MVKNKVAPPFKVIEFDIMYGACISKIGEMLGLGVERMSSGNPIPVYLSDNKFDQSPRCRKCLLPR